MIHENLVKVEERVAKACERAGRKREEVTLIAVSKTKPVDDVKEAMKDGIIDFGENKVQEIMDKYEAIPEKLNWHMIGHLQRNKVKYIVDKVCLIHSVDSLRLAIQIDEEAKKKNLVCPILIEVNAAGEDTKFGVSVQETEPLIQEIAKLSNVKIKGLMTIAPFVEDAEENRVHFQALKKLSVDIKRKNIDNVDMSILSMGMTGDYEVAIEEGATMIRVGTGIFGNRNYSI
ncbi:YggS family pyridoxal phosphate-dependent enzyme [[Clostridium] polysaccharolyticum]|uniref:Pyridoxal phosphate homeostasis protein n=1 Tax=[Clostridium] polysaccharolyticum TaxID=29364 RepID=A0A1I0E1J4_9FIRM|nr:YggS family pyridoxal phosphate-dependent enzyme [[Clostridium] polysaccharolyticum]SET38922.1 hypothetical protein SAMN04487772_11813 [[Clostridium] polysaccharolyticum]